jgi:hypothetical protein
VVYVTFRQEGAAVLRSGASAFAPVASRPSGLQVQRPSSKTLAATPPASSGGTPNKSAKAAPAPAPAPAPALDITGGMKPPYVIIDRLLCRNPAEFEELQVCGLRASHRCLLHI